MKELRNTIYQRTVREGSDSPSGGDPVRVLATDEINGYAVWVTGLPGSEPKRGPVFWKPYRNDALEAAIDYARQLRAQLEAEA